MSEPSRLGETGAGAFARTLLLDLVAELQETLGPERSRGIVSFVGLGLAEELAKASARVVVPDASRTREELAGLLVEVERRVGADFSVVSVEDDRIVLENRRCPFGAQVLGRESLCMSTSALLGGAAARRSGYARVDVERAIARGDAQCRLVVDLRPREDAGGEWSTDYHGDSAAIVR